MAIISTARADYLYLLGTEYLSLLGYDGGVSSREEFAGEGGTMGPIGMQEMIGLFVIALLLFGPKKLPELGRTLGKALSEFRRAKNELKNTFETHMNELEKETRLEPVKEFTPASYSYPYDDYGRYEEPVAATDPHQLEQAHADEPVGAVHPAVPGTIARSNGIRPVITAADQEHSA